MSDNTNNFLLIRHGFSVANKKKGLSGTIIRDPPLCRQGVIQSYHNGKLMRDKLEKDNFRVPFVICSPMLRAIQTAIFMFPDNNVKIFVCPFLKEKSELVKIGEIQIDKPSMFNQDNTISDNYDEQMKHQNFIDQIAAYNHHDEGKILLKEDLEYHNIITRVNHGLVLKEDNSFTEEAKTDGDMAKFFQWLHDNNILDAIKEHITKDTPAPIDENTKLIYPIVNHSHVIQKTFEEMYKANKAADTDTDTTTAAAADTQDTATDTDTQDIPEKIEPNNNQAIHIQFTYPDPPIDSDQPNDQNIYNNITCVYSYEFGSMNKKPSGEKKLFIKTEPNNCSTTQGTQQKGGRIKRNTATRKKNRRVNKTIKRRKKSRTKRSGKSKL